MRIIAFSDIHGAYERVKRILQKEQTFDAVVLAGDLTTHGTASEAMNVIRELQSFGKPMFAVAGNMDTPAFDEAYASLNVDINAHGVVLGETGFFGISGSPFTPMHTPYEIAEEEIARRAKRGWESVAACRWKIFVPHAPPRGTKLDNIAGGIHVGSTAVRSFVEIHQPDVLVCGHIHESRGIDRLGNTQMVNCGTAARGCYATIEINDSSSITLCEK